MSISYNLIKRFIMHLGLKKEKKLDYRELFRFAKTALKNERPPKICTFVYVSNNLYFIMLGKLAAVIIYRFSISLKFY